MLLRRMLRLVERLQRHSGLLMLRRLACVLAVAPVCAAVAEESKLTLCYREDAAPFSYLDKAGKPAGYSVELCLRAAERMKVTQPELVAVTAEDRFERLADECSILCEATTMTLKRRESMEFSLTTFLTGSAFLYPKTLPEARSEDGDTLIVGMLRQTTTHDKYRSGNLIGGDSWNFSFESVESHEVAAQKLESGALDAYIADREILEALLEQTPGLSERLQIGLTSLSFEPYALAVPLGSDAHRIAIDAMLVDLFRSGEIQDILAEHVPKRRYDPLLMDLFRIQSLPD